jgi:CheY-like chemotaxis protein
MVPVARSDPRGSWDPRERPFSISEVARFFDVTVQAVHLWMKTGRIRRQQRTSKRGNYLIPRSEVVRLLESAGREVRGLWKRPRVRVLVIDDDRSIREMVEDASRSRVQPMEVRTAANAEDGLLLAAGFSPDVILLDYFTKEGRLRGDHALAFIRKAKLIQKVRVIAIADDRRIASKMLKAGANGVLIKPFGLDEFRNAIFGNTTTAHNVGEADSFTANSQLGLTFRTSLTYPEKHPFVQKESGYRSR